MSNYGWTNADGEPIMSGEAYRFEQQLDLDSMEDYYADRFYDNQPKEYKECPECGGDMPEGGDCFDCDYSDNYAEEDSFDPPEDAWLDGSYEE